nr:hypothetical protein [Tanacetum cinerariifolium]
PKRKRRLKKKASEAGSSSPVMEQDEDVKDVNLSKTGYCAYLKGNLERTRVTPLEPLSSLTCDVLSNPSHDDTSNAANAPSSNDVDVERGTVLTGAAGKPRAEVICRQLDPIDMLARIDLAHAHEYDDIPNDDDFSTTTL